MRVFSHARLVYKDGANTRMGYASYARDAEKWVSNYWEEDPLGAPPDIYRAACVASKPQRPQEPTIHAFSGCKTT
jgi:hypothetical protein